MRKLEIQAYTLDEAKINAFKQIKVGGLDFAFKYGSKVMDFAEKEIFSKYSKIQLHASLPGKKFYIERGYSAVEYRTKKVCCDDWICIDIMEKRAPDVEKEK